MKKIFKRIKAFFILLQAERELSKAITVATRLGKQHNKRYYVIPNARHQLRVYCWSDLKQMRKQGMFSSHANETAFINESFYFTPNRFGDKLSPEKIKAKKKAWLNYIAQARHLL